MEVNMQIRDEECEKILLGTIITQRGVLNEVRDLLGENCFYKPLHQEIYKAIIQVDAKGERPDMISVKAMLDANKVKYAISEYVSVCSSETFDPYQYACRLHDLAIRRRFWEIGHYLISNSSNESEDIVDVTHNASDQLASLFNANSDSVVTLKESIINIYELINNNQAEDRPMTGTPTGFAKFDDKSGGLQKSNLIIIAGETSQGKTSFATSMMRNAAASGAKIAVYSMEMKKEEMAARLLSIESGVPANEVLYSRLTPSQIQAIDNGVRKIYDRAIFFDDRSTSSIDAIISSIRYMKMKHGIDGAIVDYLQILNVNMKGANKEQQMGDVARRLKNLAKELDIWIIALSQLNRDKDNPVPSLSRLRDSGQIAEAADVVMLIYRPEVKGKSYPDEFSNVSTKGTAMIDVAKGRNIGLLKFICGFNAPTTHFYHLDTVPMFGIREQEEMEEDNPF